MGRDQTVDSSKSRRPRSDSEMEIEAKIRVPSHELVREALTQAGARFVSRVLERNSIFDAADGSLRFAGCGLRVRECETLAGSPVGHSLTFKGPVQEGAYKTREEIETGVERADAVCRLFTTLGYVQVLWFEKRRETWVLDECEVALDELPLLGPFVEIEGDAEDRVRDVREKLGLGDEPHVKPGYVALLLAHCRAQGIESRSLGFSVRKK